MMTPSEADEAGRARYTYRLRVSSTARTALLAEWDRCRWIWNECVAKSKAIHLRNNSTGEKRTCGPAQLDGMLTEARERTPWLREGSSVPQQQVIRDFGRSRAKASKDIRERLPHVEHGRKARARLTRYDRMMARRRPRKGQATSKGYREAKTWRAKTYAKIARQRQETGRKWAKKVVTDHDAIAVEDFEPRFLARSSMARKAADAAISATKRALIEMGRKHGRDIRLVHPAHTTMDCASCGARTKHALPLSERIYTCTVCGAVSPRDKNSAHVMRAGLNPAGAEGVRPPGALLPEAA
ncbi:RNA-guided endonuclease InsQ/TnpB family protein [Streptomyces sp. NPDC059455]|uniref:RNA-guided endonuclease InsQ/TnpB family protein n=1 Tax=Streptomyces sp. NPDC059455 TaxID=3346837 RepID=UPI0036B6F68D